MTHWPVKLHTTWAFIYIHLPVGVLCEAVLVGGINDRHIHLLCCHFTGTNNSKLHSKVTVIQEEPTVMSILQYVSQVMA